MPIAYDQDQLMNVEFDPSLNEYCFSDHSIGESKNEFLSDGSMQPLLGT